MPRAVARFARSIPWLAAGILTAFAAPAAAARLGSDVAPVLEEIHLRVDPDSTTYAGWVRVTLDVRKPTPVVRLHAEGQTLERVTLTQSGRAIPVREERGEAGAIALTAAAPLAKGPALLEIRFSNAFNTQAVGLYRMVKDGAGYLFTQFEAEEARKAFPCWDEPCFKFPYRLTLEVPEREQALFNTPTERQTVERGWKTLSFEKTPPMPSYLLAIAAGPLEFVDVPGAKVPTRIVTIRGQSQLAGLAAETAPPVVAALEGYFGMPYPYRKLDLIAVPEYWYGAMENPGAITFADNALLLDPKAATVDQRRRLTRYLAHELAHMWFGDLVTMAWWDDLWLNESFADWMGDKISDQVAPQFKLGLQELENIEGIMDTDARPSTDAIHQQVEKGDEAMHNVGLAYNKGKAVLGMFEHWIGPEVFRRGINQYLAAYAWKNATAGDLWAALAQVSGKNVTAAMAGYIDHPGLPLVTIELLANGNLRLTQRRFLNYGVQAEPRRWQVPMTIRWSDGSAVHATPFLLDGPSATVPLAAGAIPAWVMPNAEARGYFRWSVPPDMMQALARQATEVMTPAERIAFLGNLAALLDAGALHGDQYLAALAELARDPEPIVAEAVIGGLGNAKRVFVTDADRDAFAVFVRRTLQPMAERFGLERREGEDEAAASVRPELLTWLGREGRDPVALALADRIAESYLADPGSVDASLAGPALQLHARQGDRALYERYRQGFENATIPAARARYLGALGCFDDPALREEALRYVFTPVVRAPETFTIPFAIASRSDRDEERMFHWLQENYDKVAAKLPPSFLNRLASRWVGCDRERLALAREFYSQSQHQVTGTTKTLAQSAEAVGDCAGLRDREGAAVRAYLRGLPEGARAAGAR
jgi:aminopeptidase N